MIANGHGKIRVGHGKVMERSWNLICQILWEPCIKNWFENDGTA